jgi:hypothetical protein
MTRTSKGKACEWISGHLSTRPEGLDLSAYERLYPKVGQAYS